LTNQITNYNLKVGGTTCSCLIIKLSMHIVVYMQVYFSKK